MSMVIALLTRILVAIEDKKSPKHKHSGIGYDGIKWFTLFLKYSMINKSQLWRIVCKAI